MTVTTIVKTLASRGPFVASDVTRACQFSGVRLFSGAEIGDVLRAMVESGEIVPSGTYVDPTTRKVPHCGRLRIVRGSMAIRQPVRRPLRECGREDSNLQEPKPNGT